MLRVYIFLAKYLYLMIKNLIYRIKGGKLIAESRIKAIDKIQAIANKESIQYDFERLDSYLSPPS